MNYVKLSDDLILNLDSVSFFRPESQEINFIDASSLKISRDEVDKFLYVLEDAEDNGIQR